MQLTKTEAEILQSLSKGQTVPKIARFRFRSQYTIKSHIKNIHLKLGATTNAQAVFLGIKHRFINLTFAFLMFVSLFPADDFFRVRVSRSVSVKIGRVRNGI